MTELQSDSGLKGHEKEEDKRMGEISEERCEEGGKGREAGKDREEVEVGGRSLD